MQRPDTRTQQLHRRVADLLQHATHDPVSPFMYDDTKDRARFFVAQRSNLGNLDFDSVNRDSAPQPFECGGRRKAVERRFVLFFQLKFGVCDAIEQFTVVGQQEQAGRLSIEPADRNDTFRHIDQIEHRAAAAFIGGRRDVAGRFVEHQVATPFPFHDLTVDPDRLPAGVDAEPHFLHDLPVNADAPVGDHLLRFAPRRQAIRRNDVLKTFQVCSHGKLNRRAPSCHPPALKGFPE